jgi:multiple sugar transport system permease protein
MVITRYRRLRTAGLYAAAALVGFWVLAPLAWMLSASLQFDHELFSIPPNWIPENPTLDNYRYVLTREAPESYQRTGMGRRVSEEALSSIPALRNTLIVATTVMVCNVVISALGAYAISRVRFSGKKTVFGYILASRLIPPIAVAIPFFAIVQALGLMNTRTALVLVYLAFTVPFTLWFLTGYFSYLPLEIEEAALVDGCNRLQVLYKIVLPLSKPGLAAAGAFAFMISYGEFIYAVFLTRTLEARTVPVVLSSAALNFDVSYALASTALVVAVVPPVLFALIFRNYILGGLSMAFGRY